MRKLYLLSVLLLCFIPAFSFQEIVIDSCLSSQLISKGISYVRDEQKTLLFTDVMRSDKFVVNKKENLNLSNTEAAFWLKFTIRNENSSTKNFLEVVQPLLQTADFYSPDAQNHYT